MRNRNRYESTLVVVRGDEEIECRIVGTVTPDTNPLNGCRDYEVSVEAFDPATGQAVVLSGPEEYEAERRLIDRCQSYAADRRDWTAREPQPEWFI